MPGIIDKIFVKVGDEVKPGQSVAVIIGKSRWHCKRFHNRFYTMQYYFKNTAMKMEYVLKATMTGTVKSIAGKVGDNIGKGVTIVEIDQPE